jgi:hypothetical protein
MKMSPRRIAMLVFGAASAGLGVYWAMTGQRTASVVCGVLAFFWVVRAVVPPRSPNG